MLVTSTKIADLRDPFLAEPRDVLVAHPGLDGLGGPQGDEADLGGKPAGIDDRDLEAGLLFRGDAAGAVQAGHLFRQGQDDDGLVMASEEGEERLDARRPRAGRSAGSSASFSNRS